jgi:hypothetical protein
MDRQVLLRKIMDVGDEIRRLEQDVIALQSIDIVEYPENYSTFSMQAATRSEYITRRLRELVYSTTNVAWQELLEGAADTLGISVKDSDGIVEITLPCLVPGKKRKHTDFIAAPLNAALDRFVRDRPPDKPFEKFTRCVICITHVYDKLLLGNGRRRDHDNIETKGIIDAINSFLLTDDNSFLCSIYNSSEISHTDCTRISIMTEDMFCRWVLDMK